jgi:hypothetical protein
MMRRYIKIKQASASASWLYHSICIEECKAVLFDPVQRRVFVQHRTQTCLAVGLKASDTPKTAHIWFSYFYGKNLFHAGNYDTNTEFVRQM